MKKMITNRIFSAAFGLLLALSLFSCENTIKGDNSVGLDSFTFPEATSIRSKKVSYIYNNGTTVGTVSNFYLDGWGDIPFLRVEDVCRMIALFNDRGYKCSEKDGVYSYNYNKENANMKWWPTDWESDWYNDTMYFDTNTQTVWSDDFVRVISSTADVNNGFGGSSVTFLTEADGIFPKTSGSSKTVQVKPKERTAICLDDYNLKMFVIDGELYVPFQALSVVFLEIVNCVFNGDDYYIFLDCLNDTNASHKAFESGRKHSATRSRLMAEYNYRVLCLTFDINYCLKSQRAELGKDNIKNFNDSIFNAGLGFDLLSCDTEIYDKAMCRFLTSYIDDGHTSYYEPSIYQSKDSVSSYDEYNWSLDAQRYKTLLVNRKALLARRAAVGGKEGVFYVSDDNGTENMAVITFDGFEMYPVDNIDPAAPDYFEKLAKANTYAFFRKAFEDIEKHNDVKNVVIDISINGGGAVNQCLTALSFLEDPENFYIPQRNQLDNSVTKFYHHIEDENGNSLKKEGYNFYVLTSDFSFSCANFFPSICKYQLGIPVVGQKSGGGAGVVKPCQTTDGVLFQTSSSREMCSIDKNDNYVCIDNGVPVDLEIAYDDFYSGDTLYKNLYKRLKEAYPANF